MSGIVDVLTFAMNGLTDQQQAIANNLANSETPGFTATDVNFQDSLAQALNDQTGGTASITTAADPGVAATDGNNVDTGSQIVDAEQNTLQYQSTAEMLNAQFMLVQGAAGGSFS